MGDCRGWDCHEANSDDFADRSGAAVLGSGATRWRRFGATTAAHLQVEQANARYTQQHTIDVGDVPGHQVRVFEVRRTYPSNPPVING